jgi:dihydrofolate reductase
MSKVVLDITTSLDGFVAGPDDGPELPLGRGGERLHEWIVRLASWREPHGLEGGETDASSALVEEGLVASGAVLMGKRMYDNAGGWGDEPPFHKPVFVVTHTRAEPQTKAGGTTFTFVTDGVESAVAQARDAAGDKDVYVAGGASVAQQCLRAGLLDELQLHVAPLLLGGGVRLLEDIGGEQIEVELTRVVDAPGVTHLGYRVVK